MAESGPPSRASGGIWKLLSALIGTVVLFVVMPNALQSYALMPDLNAKANWILLMTAIGMLLKILLGDLASGEFQYHKHGYDFCVVTLGASLSGASLQLVAGNDLYPGLSRMTSWLGLDKLTHDTVSQRLSFLILTLLVSCLLAFVTARISRAIKDKNASYPGLLSLLNYVLGVTLFGGYVLVLIAKG